MTSPLRYVPARRRREIEKAHDGIQINYDLKIKPGKGWLSHDPAWDGHGCSILWLNPTDWIYIMWPDDPDTAHKFVQDWMVRRGDDMAQAAIKYLSQMYPEHPREFDWMYDTPVYTDYADRRVYA